MRDEVLLERRGQLLIITLNRPEARNAVNLALAQGLAAALDLLDEDPNLGAGVLTGSGTGFCAGMDLKAFVRGEQPYIGDRGFAGITRRSADKPVIAAVEGFAVAGGLEIALASDLIVAADDARLGIAEVKRGLVAAAGALIRLPKRIPYHAAMELALTGELISGARAHQLGLVNRLSKPGGALAVALELAEGITKNAPLALAASKRIVSQAQAWDEPDAWARQEKITAPVLTSHDAREGAEAFAEKRPPVWQGR